MPTGVSPLYYPEQPEPSWRIVLDDSYFLVRLHDAQAFFEAGWLVRPGCVILSSVVESSFQPDQPALSLHQIATIQKNTPCRLGVNTNLTDWLPARAADTLRITLKYTVVQDTPFKDLVEQMGQAGLVAKVSLLRPDWAVAVKVSEIAGRLLSYLLREGSQHEVFSLVLDLNLSDLRTGYYAVVGSRKDAEWPAGLCLDANKNLLDSEGNLLSGHSYAVIEVRALPRRGIEIARGEPWWELLQAGKEQVLAAMPASDHERRKMLEDWRKTLGQVWALARKERACLLAEIQEMIRAAQVEVQAAVSPVTKGETYGEEDIARPWQEVLGVRTEAELRRSVWDYEKALAISRQIEQHS